jgi:hypothetical protein
LRKPRKKWLTRGIKRNRAKDVEARVLARQQEKRQSFLDQAVSGA